MSEYSRHQYSTDARVADREVAEAAGLGNLLGVVATGLALAAGAAAVTACRAGGRSLVAVHKEVMKEAEELKAARPATEAYLHSLRSAPLLAAAVVKESDSSGVDQLTSLPAARLQGLIKKGQNRLLQAQSGLLRQKVTGSLEEMGYRIRRPRRLQPGAVFVRGVKEGGSSISVSISPQTEKIELDMSGFQAGACSNARLELAEQLARRGVRLTMEERQSHNLRQGGKLTEDMNEMLTGDKQACGTRPIKEKRRQPSMQPQRQRM